MSKAEREKAIEVFENSIKCHEQQKKHICDHKCDRCGASRTYNIEEVEKAIDTALETLKQEPSEDCISRQAVKDAVESIIADYIPTFIGSQQKIPLKLAKAINKLPSVTPTQKTVSVTSAWIPVSSGKFPPSFEACEVTVVRKDKRWNQKPYIRLAEWNDELKDWFIIPYSIMRLHGERLSESDGGDATVIAWRHLTEPYKEMAEC